MTYEPPPYIQQLYSRGWNGDGDMVLTAGGPQIRDVDAEDHIWICRTCNGQLNPFGDSTGNASFVHAASYRAHDHDPDPVKAPKDAPRVRVCDFCSVECEPAWEFKGTHLQNQTGNLVHDYGSVWGACADCGPLVDARDVEAVIDRTMRTSPTIMSTGLTAAEKQEMRQRLRALQGLFIQSIESKRYVGPPVIPSRLDPRMLPKVQQGLGRLWRNPALYERLATKGHDISIPFEHTGDEPVVPQLPFARRYYNGENPPREVFERHAHHLAAGIDVAKLFWISEDFTTLASMAGLDLTEITLSNEDLPARFGMIVWARPIGEIPRPYGVAGVRALSWTPVPGGVWFNVYFQSDDADPEITDPAAVRAEWGYLMAPNVGTGLPWGTTMPVDEHLRVEGNFLLTLFATWYLMRQPGVVVDQAAPVDKKLARSYARAKKTMPDVRIVDLRRHVRPKPETDAEAAERRKIGVRFMVRGHWKNQAYGPKRGLRKHIYISPFIKGPEDAPLKTEPPTVRVLR